MDGNIIETFFFHFYFSIRIQVGDQIIEVDDHSLVGVTHIYATNVLKNTSGLVKYDLNNFFDICFFLKI
jgi:hypothetical protein